MNAEQASKYVMREPSRLSHGEGRRSLVEQVLEIVPEDTSERAQVSPAGVVASACVEEETNRNTGSLDGGGA